MNLCTDMKESRINGCHGSDLVKCCKAFVQPKMIPGSTGNKITKVLKTQNRVIKNRQPVNIDQLFDILGINRKKLKDHYIGDLNGLL